MASDAPLIGLNAPLKNHCLALDIFCFPFSDLPICAVFKDFALEKSGLALKLPLRLESINSIISIEFIKELSNEIHVKQLYMNELIVT